MIVSALCFAALGRRKAKMRFRKLSQSSFPRIFHARSSLGFGAAGDDPKSIPLWFGSDKTQAKKRRQRIAPFSKSMAGAICYTDYSLEGDAPYLR